jgi:plasmid stabilization system protein ParE
LHLSWSPAAEEDLLQIWRYIADQTSAARADEQIRKIKSAAQMLRDWPFSGRSR